VSAAAHGEVWLDAGGGVALRTPRPGDTARIAALADNRNVWINLLDVFPHPYGLEDARMFLDLVAALPAPLTHLAITVDDVFVGMGGFDVLPDVHRAAANIGYWIGEPYWGRGIATRAVRALSAYAFANFPIERLQAEVFAWNPASARVLEKSGYTQEGRARRSVLKAGQVIDGLLYARLRGDP
jgi:RimJ/RimL family protein N-acetyltransferase